MKFITVAVSAIMATAVMSAPSTGVLTKRGDRCVVEIFSDKDYSGDYQSTTNNWNCLNFNLQLAGKLSSYKVSGCACDFFEDWNCNGYRFDADNRADSNLGNGDNNDRMKSLKCH